MDGTDGLVSTRYQSNTIHFFDVTNLSRGMQYTLYITSVIGAISLYMMMPRAGYNPRTIGALLGGITLGALWLQLYKQIPQPMGLEQGAFPYYYVFSGLAIGSAVRVITHTKPVYAALWFVMVILASSGLFLTLSAGFIAFAMIIIYGGAILVTYLFVIMLAAKDQPSHASDDHAGHLPLYNLVAYEPAGAVAAGFLLLAVLLTAIFDPIPRNAGAMAPSDHEIITTVLTDRPDQRLANLVDPEEAAFLPRELVDPQLLSNTEKVGLDLFQSHPLGLELAGIILLVALVGAVVITKQHVEPETSNPLPMS